jgi:hypothetical protein
VIDLIAESAAIDRLLCAIPAKLAATERCARSMS